MADENKNEQQQQPAAAQGWWVWDALTGIAIAYLVVAIMNLFVGSEISKLTGTAAPLVDQPFVDGIMPNVSKEILTPMMSEKAPFMVDVWLSYYYPKDFWKTHDKNPEAVGEPVWSMYNLTYEAGVVQQLNLTIPFDDSDEGRFFSQIMTKNASLYVHMQIYTPDIYDSGFALNKAFEEQPLKVFRNSVPLVKHMKK